jgi:hypothetical protein
MSCETPESASCEYYAMRVAGFLALEAMLPHQEMKARGLVVPLSMDVEHKLRGARPVRWLDPRSNTVLDGCSRAPKIQPVYFAHYNSMWQAGSFVPAPAFVL